MIAAGDIFGDIVSTVSNVLGGVASSAASGIITVFAHAVLGSLTRAIEWLSTVWMNTPTPRLVNASGAATGTVAWMQHELLPLTAALAVGSIIVGGAKLAVSEAGHTQAREFTRWLFVYALASLGGVAFAAMVITTCDGFANYIVAQATVGSNFGDHLAQGLGLATQAVGSGTLQPQGGFLLGLAGTAASAMLAIVIGADRAGRVVCRVRVDGVSRRRAGDPVRTDPFGGGFLQCPYRGALAAADRRVDRRAGAVQARGRVLLCGGVSALGRHRRDRGHGRARAAGRLSACVAGAAAADAPRGRAFRASPGSGRERQDGDRRDADRSGHPRRRRRSSDRKRRRRAAARRHGRASGCSGRRTFRGRSAPEVAAARRATAAQARAAPLELRGRLPRAPALEGPRVPATVRAGLRARPGLRGRSGSPAQPQPVLRCPARAGSPDRDAASGGGPVARFGRSRGWSASGGRGCRSVACWISSSRAKRPRAVRTLTRPSRFRTRIAQRTRPGPTSHGQATEVPR